MVIKVTVMPNSNRNKSEDSHDDAFSDARLDGQKQENVQTDQSEDIDYDMSEPYSQSSQPTSRDRHSRFSHEQLQPRVLENCGQGQRLTQRT